MRFEFSDLNGVKGNRNRDKRRNDRRDRRDNNRDRRQDSNRQYDSNGNKNTASVKADNGFSRGVGTRTFYQEDSTDSPAEEKSLPDDVAKAADILDAFLNDYNGVLQDHGNQLPLVIQDLFWDVSAVMTHYYDGKYQPVVGQLNSVLDIVCTHRFALSLSNVLTNEDVDGWNDGVWKDVMFVYVHP